MKPGRRDLFTVAARLLALALAALSIAIARQAGLAWLVAIFALVATLRVPRRRLLVELGAAGLFLALLSTGWDLPFVLALALAVLCALLRALAPEAGLLRLNGMDRYFVAQDYPGTAMNIHVILELDRPLERDLLLRAVEAFGRDVPMARSFVREAPLGVERFVARRPFVTEDALVTWLDAPESDDALEARLAAPIDLAEAPPFRITHGPRKGGHHLIVTIHHSAGDGVGIFLLSGWLLDRYAAILEGREPRPIPASAEGTRFRDLARPRGIGWLYQMVRRHVRPLDKVGVENATLLDDRSPIASRPRHRRFTIAVEEWSALDAAAKGAGRTRNDLLVCAALRATAALTRERGAPARPFRVMLPTNLRPSLHLGPSLANYVGVVRAEFTADEVASTSLAAQVGERIRIGRTLEEAVETPVNLGVMSLVLPPWLFRAALRKLDADQRSTFFTFLFSAVPPADDLPRVPGIAIERAWVRSPLTRRPGFGLILTRDHGRVEVALVYLTPLVKDQTAARFEELFLAEVRGFSSQSLIGSGA